MIGFRLARTHQGARSIAIPTRTNACADHQRCTLGLVSRADLMHEILRRLGTSGHRAGEAGAGISRLESLPSSVSRSFGARLHLRVQYMDREAMRFQWTHGAEAQKWE